MRLGIDFGEGAIVIAACGPGLDSHTVSFPGLSREIPGKTENPPVNIIPSLVEYRGGKAELRGDEVLRGGNAEDPATARWIRRALCERSPMQVPAGNSRCVRYEEAAMDLLTPLLSLARERYPGSDLIFAIPPDAPPVYGEVLLRAARAAGAGSCSTISEYEAVLAGYGCPIRAGETVLLLTLSESDLGIVVLSREGHSGNPGERLRVLAHATGTVSCRLIDMALVQDILEKFRLQATDPRAVRLMPRLHYEAARLRECVPAHGDTEIRLTDPVSGKTFSARYTAADMGRVLSASEIIPSLLECIDRAISVLRSRGCPEAQIGTVLLVGAGCALPVVQNIVRARFPHAVLHTGHALDAVALGAALFSEPVPAQDRIARSYALRYWDPAAQEHHYRFLVHSGTRYPSAGQVARVIISAAYDGQTLLGIPLYEIDGENHGGAARIELVSDAGGGVRIAGPAQDESIPGGIEHANERSPTLLVAAPPARKGEPRFECTFTIDPERNLCLSARDLLTGTLVKLNTPVHRLT